MEDCNSLQLLCGNVRDSFWTTVVICFCCFSYFIVEKQIDELAEQREWRGIWVIFWEKLILQVYPRDDVFGGISIT